MHAVRRDPRECLQLCRVLWQSLCPPPLRLLGAIGSVFLLLWGECCLPTLAVAATDEAEVAYAKGILEYDQGDYLKALDYFRTTIAATPKNANAQFYLGLTLNRLGEFAEAIPALETALQLDPTMQPVHYNLGLAYFQDNRYEDALKQLRLAEQFDPKNAAVQFYQGYASYQLQRYEQVPPYMDRALALDPSLKQVVPYYRGLAFYELGRDSDAENALQTALVLDPTSTLGRNAERYLNVIKQRAGERRQFQVQGMVGFQFDDNVILEPNDLEVSKQADGRAVITVDGKWLPVRTSQWQLGVEYQFFQTAHFNLNDFDIQNHTLGLFSRYALKPVTLGLTANYAYTLRDNNSFAGIFTVEPSATIPQASDFFAVVSLRYRLEDFFEDLPAGQKSAERDRDGWNMRGGFQQYFTFNQKRSYVRLSYYFDASRNDGTDWEYNGHEVGLSLATPLWAGISVNVDGTYNRRDYLHRHSFDRDPLAVLTAADTRAREDNRWTGAVMFSRPLGASFTLSAGYAHISNSSNLAFFDYRRNIVTLALTGRY